MGKQVRRLTPSAEKFLKTHPFHSNVWELRNIMERVALLSQGEDVTEQDLHSSGIADKKSALQVQINLNDKADEEMIYIHGDICYGKVVIKDDTPQVSLSPMMYEEFSWQYNAKIFDEFKGTYHCCGSINDHIYKLLDQNKNVKGINYGNPENHNIKDIYKKNKGKKRAIYTWGWNQDYSFLKELLKDEEISTGITLACKAKDIEDGKRIIGEYLNIYA